MYMNFRSQSFWFQPISVALYDIKCKLPPTWEDSKRMHAFSFSPSLSERVYYVGEFCFVSGAKPCGSPHIGVWWREKQVLRWAGI